MGAARAYTDAGFAVGVYSTPYLWETVVGNFELGVIRSGVQRERRPGTRHSTGVVTTASIQGGAGRHGPVGAESGATRTSPVPGSRSISASGSTSTA